jgi:hypothetical protein
MSKLFSPDRKELTLGDDGGRALFAKMRYAPSYQMQFSTFAIRRSLSVSYMSLGFLLMIRPQAHLAADLMKNKKS